MKTFQITAAAFLLLAGFSIARAQMCGGWSVKVTIVDVDDQPIKNAGLRLINVSKEDKEREIKFLSEANDGNFVGRFTETGGYSLKYEARIFAPGYAEKFVVIPVYFCRSSSNKFSLKRLTNQQFRLHKNKRERHRRKNRAD